MLASKHTSQFQARCRRRGFWEQRYRHVGSTCRSDGISTPLRNAYRPWCSVFSQKSSFASPSLHACVCLPSPFWCEPGTCHKLRSMMGFCMCRVMTLMMMRKRSGERVSLVAHRLRWETLMITIFIRTFPVLVFANLRGFSTSPLSFRCRLCTGDLCTVYKIAELPECVSASADAVALFSIKFDVIIH